MRQLIVILSSGNEEECDGHGDGRTGMRAAAMAEPHFIGQ